jgi:aspartate 1-decarboxylase
MLTRLLKAKLHRPTVTFTDEDYHGSITIDIDLLRASGLVPNEMVLIADSENGNRFETYVIPGEAGSGVIAINGAAAKLTGVGHRLIVMSFVDAAPAEVLGHVAKIVIVDGRNRVSEIIEQPTDLARAHVQELPATARR